MSQATIDTEIQDIIQKIEQDSEPEVTMYEELAPVYDYLFGTAYDYELQADYVQKAVSEEESVRILEVGCGTGRLLTVLADRFPDATIHGVDIHEGMVNISRDRSAEHDTVTVDQSDFFDTEGEFDVVVAFNTVPHFDDTLFSDFCDHSKELVSETGAVVFDYKDPQNNPNGLRDIWEKESDKFRITTHFLTVYDNAQPYYAVSYEFVSKATQRHHLTGDLMKMNFQTPETIEQNLRAAGFTRIAHDPGAGDQSGIVIAN